MVMGKTLAAATFGVACWGAAMATGIAMLQNLYPSLLVPWERLASLALFALAASWANACFAASLSLRLANETAARRLVRAPGLVMVLTLVLAPRILPASIGEPILSLLRAGRLSFTLVALTFLLIPAGFWLSAGRWRAGRTPQSDLDPALRLALPSLPPTADSWSDSHEHRASHHPPAH